MSEVEKTEKKLAEAVESAKPLEKAEEPEASGEPAETEDEAGADKATNGWLERFYDNFSAVPLKWLDAFIVICIVALIAVVAIGVLKAKGLM